MANGLLAVLVSLCLAVRTGREALQATPGGSQGDAHPPYRPLEVERAVAGGGDDRLGPAEARPPDDPGLTQRPLAPPREQGLRGGDRRLRQQPRAAYLRPLSALGRVREFLASEGLDADGGLPHPCFARLILKKQVRVCR